MRGKVFSFHALMAAVRITPACAGKRANDAGKAPAVQDHPRVCGEKFLGFHRDSSFRGSPPRVRGKDFSMFSMIGFGRITPACAGKSLFMLILADFNEDHPRVCGEKVFAPARSHTNTGSPPRVRGKAFKAAEKLGVERITPACAGKSLGK